MNSAKPASNKKPNLRKPIVCKRCEKAWHGHHMYCPKNPVKGHKWDECVCFVHTCYDAKKDRESRAKDKSHESR